MIVLMKCLNEERYVYRCISDFHNDPWVDRIVVIDGGSTDYTVPELKQFDKVEVYVHPWADWYHDMEVAQSNIALSYIPQGKVCFILDFDERISPELRLKLADINSQENVEWDTAHVSRRTVEPLRHEDTPFAVLGDDGWPVESHQIGQYPDYQCRLLKRQVGMHWVNSPHHVLFGSWWVNVNIQADIIHFEKDDLRDRQRIEKKWLRSQVRRRQLGLVADIFETNVKPELGRYLDPRYWR